LDGHLLNFADVEQHAGLNVNGSLMNDRSWRMTGGAGLTTSAGTGVVTNKGLVRIELDAPGRVDIDVPFFNTLRSISGYDKGVGILQVGRTNAPNPATEVRFNGSDFNLVDGVLRDGVWHVGPGYSLVFPADIESVWYFTWVRLHGDGQIPSLKLKKNFGELTFRDTTYTTPGNVENQGVLILDGSSTLNVNGGLVLGPRALSVPEIRCQNGAQIHVAGDVTSLRGTVLRNDGTVRVGGAAALNGRVEGSGCFVMAMPSALTLAEDVFVGSSPGTMEVEGSVALADTAVLSIELTGTQPGRFDVLSATGNATLGGRLAVNLSDGFRPSPGDIFPVVQAGSQTGRFANAAEGQRIETIDGYGSQVVHYTPTAVVLKAFELNPDPVPTAPATLRSPAMRADGAIGLTLTGSPGRAYRLESSMDLTVWTMTATGTVEYDGFREFLIVPNGEPSRFFRAQGL